VLFSRLAGAMLLVLPFLFTSVILWGCRGQLAAHTYPSEWFTANRILNQDQGHFQSVFLPWHLYMYYGFAGRIIASPAPAFFDKPMVVSDDPEYNGAGAANTSGIKQAAGHILSEATTDNSFAAKLAGHNIKYLLLAKEDDFDHYNYLSQKTGLQRIYHSDTLDIYRNNAYKEAAE
jgi:hypothetical protein